jgi:hypothetical protein
MDRRLGGGPWTGLAGCEWTDRVRGSGRVRRKKWMNFEMADDVPGTAVPDPSLDGAPRAVGPAAHHHGVSRPADRALDCPTRSAGNTGVPDGPKTARRRSRGGGVLPPGLCTTLASGRGCARSRGVRVHRGEPLLLGVDEEYQISYRLFAHGS